MIPSFSVPVPCEPSILIANYGGGPALEVCITIKGDPADPLPHGSIHNDEGGMQGTQLVVGSEQTTANHKDGSPADILPYLNRQTEYLAVCGPSEPQAVLLDYRLLARLLPLTIEAEERGYRTAGVPPELGRVSWLVHIAYKTALDAAHERTFKIYAERTSIDFHRGDDGIWVEKHFHCHLVVEPSAGFQTTPIRTDATVFSPGPAQLRFGPTSPTS